MHIFGSRVPWEKNLGSGHSWSLPYSEVQALHDFSGYGLPVGGSTQDDMGKLQKSQS